jgi:putative spermidine/putrescine transport system ATP-binding protein
MMIRARADIPKATGANLELSTVTRRYGTAAAVDGISLRIEAGEFFTLLGSSGSGKTTTLMMIAGFVEPSAGSILIDGRDVTRLPPSRRDLGVVFQNYSLFPHLTVARNVAFPLEMRGVGRAERETRVRAMLDLVKLPDKADVLPRQLSGGQQQRVALARALVFNPRALLMDEPLGALDKKLREHMQLEIKRLQGELGATVVYVTHDQEEALTMSDRIAVMAAGRIAQLGAPADLYERPANRWVADFIGQSNFIDGIVAADGIRLASGERIRHPAGAFAAGSAVTLVVRPEKIRIQPSATAATDALLVGTVREAIYVGHATRIGAVLADGNAISIDVQNRSDAPRVAVGDTVQLSWAKDDAWLIPAETSR